MLACQVYSQNFYVFVTIYSTRRAAARTSRTIYYTRAPRGIFALFSCLTARNRYDIIYYAVVPKNFDKRDRHA